MTSLRTQQANFEQEVKDAVMRTLDPDTFISSPSITVIHKITLAIKSEDGANHLYDVQLNPAYLNKWTVIHRESQMKHTAETLDAALAMFLVSQLS